MAKASPKKKKIIACIMAAACLVSLVGLLMLSNGDISFDIGAGETEPRPGVSNDATGKIDLCFPDWESDIFENPAYLDKNRYITYVEGGMAVTIVDEDYTGYGEVTAMFADYIYALTHGYAEMLNSFYADEFFANRDRWEAITMQKIYDVRVERILEGDITHETYGRVTRHIYKLTYKIMQNDGTFRADVKSDAEKPLFYEILDTGERLMILSVSPTLNTYTQ